MVNVAALRLKARIGQLKALGLLIIIFGGIVLLALSDSLSAALNNSSNPQPMTLDQFVDGKVDTNKFVGVTGRALYQTGYYMTDKSNEKQADYYYLLDDRTGNMLLVKSPTLIPDSQTSKSVTIYGLTHNTESELQNLIDGDRSKFAASGVQTTSALYLGEAEVPPSPVGIVLPVAIIAILILLSIASFFFPNIVFAPMPIDGSLVAGDYTSNVQATGRFLKLASIKPSIQFGKGSRKFNRSVANIWAMPDRSWLIYIHFVYTYRVNGVTVRKTETDWGLPLTSTNVTDIQPGKLFGWHDRWAVRFQYNDEQEKQQSLIVSFKEQGAQVAFVRVLGQSGMYVGSGEPGIVFN